MWIAEGTDWLKSAIIVSRTNKSALLHIKLRRASKIIEKSAREGSISNFQFSIFNFHAKNSRKRGFTLIEVVIDFGILALITVAVLGAYSASLKSIDLAKAKIAAVALANEKMEFLRNLPYDDLATEHGAIYPPGSILDDEEVTRKGIRFTVKTEISPVDDPYDGTAGGGSPDLNPADYKKIDITVSKVGAHGYLAKISSSFAAKAAETAGNTGIARICVFGEDGQPVAGATLTIKNTTLTPPVNMSLTIPDDGCYMVPNLPPDDHNHYNLSVTKAGYSTDSTYPRTSQNPNQLQPDVNIIVQQVTNQTLSIDRLGNLTIQLVDDAGDPIANAAVHVEGAKEIYFNPRTPKYAQDFTSDGDGKIVLNNMEFDQYTVTVDDWIIAASSPYEPIDLKAGQNLVATLHLTHSNTLPVIVSAEPVVSQRGTVLALSVNGRNFSSPTIKIVDGQGNEIGGTNVVVTSHGQDQTIDADINLASAAVGIWDIIVTNDDGENIRQVGGLEVVN